MRSTGPESNLERRVLADPVLQTFLALIAPIRGQLRELILFGSRARDDAGPDSDYDLLVVVPGSRQQFRDPLYDGVLQTLLTHGRLISLKIFTEAEFRRLNGLRTPFMERVQAEGIRLG